MLKVNQIYEGEIIGLDYKADGYLKIKNKIIFIQNTLPGEIVSFKVTKVRKNHATGEVVKYIKQSKIRINKYSNLGSINFDHVPLSFELKWQQELTEYTFKKIFKKDFNIYPTVTDNNKYNSRNKVVFHVLNKDELTLGLYLKKSKRLVRVNSFNLANINANKMLTDLNNSNITIDYNSFKHLSIKNDANNNLLVTIVSYKKRFKGLDALIIFLRKYSFIKGITLNIKENNYQILGSNSILLYGINELVYKDLLINDRSFMQVNYNVMDLTYELIKENVYGNIIVDLYSGIGSIIYSVLEENQLGYMIENDQANIELAKDIKNNKAINNLTIIEDDTINVIEKLKGDTFIVDPPQSGLGITFTNKLKSKKVKRIIYLSCNLNTLINDLKILKEAYNITKIYPIRMFPNTIALETLVILDLKS